jgi:tetratricopeptide (TPR) repeat protein
VFGVTRSIRASVRCWQSTRLNFYQQECSAAASNTQTWIPSSRGASIERIETAFAPPAYVHTCFRAVSSPLGDAVDDQEIYFKERGDAAIAACTRLIETGGFAQNDLAEIYYNRGVTWYDEGAYDRVIEDYDQALKLNPNFTPAVFKRGNSYDAKRLVLY